MPRTKSPLRIHIQPSCCSEEERADALAQVSALLMRAERRRLREIRLASIIQQVLALVRKHQTPSCSQQILG